MDISKVPKLITSEVIESVLSNEEALKKLFHLQDEEGFVEGETGRVAWNSKMIKLLLCDVQIYVQKGGNESKNNTSYDDGQAKIYINVSDLSSRKDDGTQASEIERIKESIILINEKIENFQAKLRKLETQIKDFEYDFEIDDYCM